MYNPWDIIDVSKIGDISYDNYFYKEKGRDDLDLSLKDLYADLERRIRNDIGYGTYL